jgi:adenylate cyclase
MGDLSRQEVAARAGVGVDYLERLVAAGMLTPDADDRLPIGAVRRAGLMWSLEEGGLPLEGIAAAIRSGELSLDFVDTPTYDRFAALSNETFEQASARTGVPLPLLMLIRDANGSAPAHAGDLIRDDEQEVIPFIEAQVKLGFKPVSIERLLRVNGDSLRRIAESEADWWRSEVTTPNLEAGKRGAEVSEMEGTEELNILSERAFLAMYHAQQTKTWTSNIISGFEYVLTKAGLHSRLEQAPAVCFLDITGYTRLTQERGDQAAAELASQLSRLVQRTSLEYGGRPIKWLGDGVMFFFKDPGPGVVAALEMVAGVVDAGLPPAHVGLHAGPVLFQEGDYYGQTVNVASRIAEYARPGEVLVSQEVVDASQAAQASFTDIGPVELKGVSGVMRLHAAHRVA